MYDLQKGDQTLWGGLGELHAVKRLIATRGVAKHLLGGFGGMLPEKMFFKLCNLVHFGAYFHTCFYLKTSKNIHSLYKNNGNL